MPEVSKTFIMAAKTTIQKNTKGTVVVGTVACPCPSSCDSSLPERTDFINVPSDQEVLEDRRAEALLLQAPFL